MDSSAESQRRIEAPVALIERLDRDDRVLQSTLIYRWPMKIGRSFDADLVLDDPHMAPLHAELSCDAQGLHLKVGETINGAFVGKQHVGSGQTVMLRAAQPWRLGATRLRVRLASDPVAPEQPLEPHHVLATHLPQGSAWASIAPLTLLAVASLLFEQWLESDPGLQVTAYLSVQLMWLGAAMAWTLLWALGSKLFQGHLLFRQHFALVLRHGLIWMALDAALPILAYVTGWTVLSRITGLVGMAVLCRLLWGHLALVMPTHRKGLMAAALTCYLSGVGLTIWLNEQSVGSPFSELYAAALPPPSWRLAGTQAPEALIDDARALKGRLDQLAKEDSLDDSDDEDTPDDGE